MSKYHKYVFDHKNREFVGNFEEMYQAELNECFDSWHQEDSRQLQRKIDIAILENYNFNTIIDIGCGKGSFTHLLKRSNNHVLAIDISSTAINIAKERYPDIEFIQADVNNIAKFEDLLIQKKKLNPIDLVFSSEAFSYIENWKDLINLISKHTNYFLISLFIPDNPIGFIKSEEDLLNEIEKNFEIIESLHLRKRKFVIIFAKKNVEDQNRIGDS